MPAANIQQCIDLAAPNIAKIVYSSPPTLNLLTQTTTWIDLLFGVNGVFPPTLNAQRDPGQRPVTNWLYTTLAAKDATPSVGAGLLSAAAVTNAVIRTCYAVADATADGNITPAQQAAVVAAFNTCFP